MNNENKKVIVNALKYYGAEKELIVCMEELSELIQAISKAERYPEQESYDNVAEEIADVLIIIEYLKLIYSIDQSEVEKWISKKIKRLKERME